MKSKSQILSKLRADGHITDEEYKMLKQEPKTGEIEDMIPNEKDIPTGHYIHIPENPTNGDIIKASFPNCPCKDIVFDYAMYEDENRQKIIAIFPKEWWYAPYKKEGETE